MFGMWEDSLRKGSTMPKKKVKRGAAKKAARKAKDERTAVESNVDVKTAKALDSGDVTGGFVSFKVHGDQVGGTILAIEEVKSRWGLQKKVTVKSATGTKGFFCPTMLDTYISDNGVKVGDFFAVRYVDDIPTGKGSPAKSFRVVFTPSGKKSRK